MPRVGYAMPQQGFRPRTNPLGALRNIGLRGLGDSNTFSGCVSAVDAQGNAVSCSDPSAAVWFDANMNAVTPGTSAQVLNNAAGVPTGSILMYQGQWRLGIVDSANTILQKVTAALPAHGIQVVSSKIDQSYLASTGLGGRAQFGVLLSLRVVGPGFNLPEDAASWVNNAYYNATGEMPINAITSLQSIPSSPVGATSSTQVGVATLPPGSSAPMTGWSQWLQNNALWVGLAVVAITIGPTLVKKVL